MVVVLELFEHWCLVLSIFEGQHFTLLSLTKHEGGGIDVRYCDSLTTPSKQCLEAAGALLSGLGCPTETIVRVNMSFQSGHECSSFCMRYIELEERRALGEELVSTGLPTFVRLKTLRKQVDNIHACMRREHTGWMRRLDAESKKHHELMAKVREAHERLLRQRLDTGAVKNELARLATASVHAYESVGKEGRSPT